MKNVKEPVIRSAWVLGSTSTVAVSICRVLAEQGCRRFHLLARNVDRNQIISKELIEGFGAQVSCESFDLLSLKSYQPL